MQGDATQMPFSDGRFSAVVAFTMLHHLPSGALQDRMLAEVARVLRAGGVFAGTDSIGTGPLFRMLHLGDTLVPVNPGSCPIGCAARAWPTRACSGVGARFAFAPARCSESRASRSSDRAARAFAGARGRPAMPRPSRAGS
jgi:SAM-dependent methyltransferase